VRKGPQTSFHCTNFSGANETFTGLLVVNTPVMVAHLGTVTFSTMGTLLFRVPSTPRAQHYRRILAEQYILPDHLKQSGAAVVLFLASRSLFNLILRNDNPCGDTAFAPSTSIAVQMIIRWTAAAGARTKVPGTGGYRPIVASRGVPTGLRWLEWERTTNKGACIL
jgi:hypothetical protein